ncbi:hypothetical protein BJX61DRAFT_540081 [Aspergillus egyptiacus]|nr:hypothetical protein BJX61DRAFT_540081 [Aspergillus egyptiacus]
MKFTLGLAALSLFAAANALPNLEAREAPRAWDVPSDMTVEQASSKCGDQAQLSCCNDVRYGGDSTVVQEGIAAGLLSNLLGTGSASEGLGAFSGCSKLDVAAAIGVQDILNQKCKQNIACCAQSGSSANGNLVGAALPCIALGSVL